MRDVIEKKIDSGERITEAEALFLLQQDLPFLGKLANKVRGRFHPEKVATFIVDMSMNFTNVCSRECGFCAFYVNEDDPNAFVRTKEDVLEKVKQLSEAGGTQVLLQGGINPALGLDYYLDLVRAVKMQYPQITIHAFSPPEVKALAEKERLTIIEVLAAMRDAGLSSLPGGGAEILVERVRDIVSPNKISAEHWLYVMRCAHHIGMKSTATMMFGSIETEEERIEHLHQIRQLQDETSGFRAFIPWTFSPSNTCFSDIIPVGGGEYLKTLAVARIYLDNIEHIGAGWLTEGMKTAQVALHFGANDMGGVLTQEQVIESTGMSNYTNTEEIIENIRAAGFRPARRDTQYNILEYFD